MGKAEHRGSSKKKTHDTIPPAATYSLQDVIEKIDTLRKADDFDLSLEQDLVIGIMNLISIEEHLFFSYNKTKKQTYLTLLKQIREHRKALLQKIIVSYEGEVWCTCKHLLATSMRLMEVGTKQLGAGNTDTAKEFFDRSYDMYCMFWGLVLDVISDDPNSQHVVGDVIDCCNE